MAARQRDDQELPMSALNGFGSLAISSEASAIKTRSRTSMPTLTRMISPVPVHSGQPPVASGGTDSLILEGNLPLRVRSDKLIVVEDMLGNRAIICPLESCSFPVKLGPTRSWELKN